MNKLKAACIAGTALASVGMVFGTASRSYAAFNLVNDGSFEQGNAGGAFAEYNNGSNFGGWHVDSGSVDLIGSYWTSADGNQSVDMNGASAGTISQTISGLTVGHNYLLSFWLAGNPTGAPTIKTIDTVLGGNTIGSNSFDITGKTYAAMGWTEYSYNFTAATASTTLAFASTVSDACSPVSGASACGPALDNVSIRAVPEAATTITAIAYILLTGMVFMIRSRKRSQASA